MEPMGSLGFRSKSAVQEARVQGFAVGSAVWGLGFSLGFRTWGLGFSLGFRV